MQLDNFTTEELQHELNRRIKEEQEKRFKLNTMISNINGCWNGSDNKILDALLLFIPKCNHANQNDHYPIDYMDHGIAKCPYCFLQKIKKEQWFPSDVVPVINFHQINENGEMLTNL